MPILIDNNNLSLISDISAESLYMYQNEPYSNSKKCLVPKLKPIAHREFMMRKLKKLNPNNAMDGISIISTNYRSANASSIDEHNKRKNPKTFNVEEYFAKKAISRMKTKK